jgi:hypothetical protein
LYRVDLHRPLLHNRGVKVLWRQVGQAPERRGNPVRRIGYAGAAPATVNGELMPIAATGA